MKIILFRAQLSTESHLRVADPDSVPERVWLHVEEISASLDLVDRLGARLRRFSLAELLHGDVFLLAEDGRDEEVADRQPRDGHLTLASCRNLNIHPKTLTKEAEVWLQFLGIFGFIKGQTPSKIYCYTFVRARFNRYLSLVFRPIHGIFFDNY